MKSAVLVSNTLLNIKRIGLSYTFVNIYYEFVKLSFVLFTMYYVQFGQDDIKRCTFKKGTYVLQLTLIFNELTISYNVFSFLVFVRNKQTNKQKLTGLLYGVLLMR